MKALKITLISVGCVLLALLLVVGGYVLYVVLFLAEKELHSLPSNRKQQGPRRAQGSFLNTYPLRPQNL